MQEHAQANTTLPFANGECFAANFLDVKQLINNNGDESIKNVYELTLQIKVSVSHNAVVGCSHTMFRILFYLCALIYLLRIK